MLGNLSLPDMDFHRLITEMQLLPFILQQLKVRITVRHTAVHSYVQRDKPSEHWSARYFYFTATPGLHRMEVFFEFALHRDKPSEHLSAVASRYLYFTEILVWIELKCFEFACPSYLYLCSAYFPTIWCNSPLLLLLLLFFRTCVSKTTCYWGLLSCVGRPP